MSIENPFFVEPPYKDPQTISEMAQNDIVYIHNQAAAGKISVVEAKDQMDEVEKIRIEVGDGWFDRYGPPPAELDFLYQGDERYWERERPGQ